MKAKHLLSMTDLAPAETLGLIRSALRLKRGGGKPMLAGKTLALLFQKPSMRTRVSFEVAMHQLGGRALYLSQAEVGLGQREPVEDVARVLSRYVDGVAARVFGHEIVVGLAAHASVPVINALSDAEHPCQALADLMTVHEKKGGLKGVTIAYVGDGNNCATSLALGAAQVGAHFHIASPKGYELPREVWAKVQAYAKRSSSRLLTTSQPDKAVTGADAVYTDVWASMGQEAEAKERRRTFRGYQVTAALLAQAKRDVIFLHPLPAHHGEEIERGLLEHSGSVVFDEAENRLHAQKALLTELLGRAS
ncbi:MAG: ornithine carbamoyltransferase [Chloroflexi bacterium]|nr:ornithine carbamoyltransferase [Chloroflexota bacterium]